MKHDDESIGSLITKIGHAINANNGACPLIEEALTKSLDITLKAERIFAAAKEYRHHAVSPEGERYAEMYFDARNRLDAVLAETEPQTCES